MWTAGSSACFLLWRARDARTWEVSLGSTLASTQSNKLNGADLPVVQRLSPTVQMPVTCNTAPAIAEQSRLQERTEGNHNKRHHWLCVIYLLEAWLTSQMPSRSPSPKESLMVAFPTYLCHDHMPLFADQVSLGCSGEPRCSLNSLKKTCKENRPLKTSPPQPQKPPAKMYLSYYTCDFFCGKSKINSQALWH